MNFDLYKFRLTLAPAEQDAKNVRDERTPHPNNVREWRTLPEWAYPALCVAVLSLLTMLPAKGGPLLPKQIDIDSSVYRYVGKVILSGGAPYRDTFDHKGPFLYFIQVAGLVLGYYGVWLMGILNCLFTFAFFYKIARLCGCSLRLSCTALIFVALLFPYYQVHINAAESYSLPFLSASLYCFLRYFMERNVTKPQIALCGFSCAALFLLKPNFVGLFLVTLPGIIADRIRKKQFQAIFHDAFYFSLGFLALALPTALWLSFNRAFTDFIRTVLLFNFQYTSGTSKPVSVSMFLKALYQCATRPMDLLSLGILLYRSLSRKNLHDALCFLLYLAHLVIICASGRTSMYYDILNLPLMFYALVSLLVPFDAIMTRNQKRALSFAFAFVLSLLFMGPVARSFLQYDTSLFQIAQIVREHSDETDKITVCGNADSVYLFSERQSVSKYSYQTPVCFLVKSQQSEQMREEYFRDLKTKKPKLIVLPPTEKFKAYSEVKEIMGDHYRLLEVIDGIEIYLLTQ